MVRARSKVLGRLPQILASRESARDFYITIHLDLARKDILIYLELEKSRHIKMMVLIT